jgi:hypothetical protein
MICLNHVDRPNAPFPELSANCRFLAESDVGRFIADNKLKGLAFSISPKTPELPNLPDREFAVGIDRKRSHRQCKQDCAAPRLRATQTIEQFEQLIEVVMKTPVATPDCSPRCREQARLWRHAAWRRPVLVANDFSVPTKWARLFVWRRPLR